jgi:hypothetical protein
MEIDMDASANVLANVRPGDDTQPALTMSVTVLGTNGLDLHTRVIEHVARLPGLQAAALAWGVSLTGNPWCNNIEIVGDTPLAA